MGSARHPRLACLVAMMTAPLAMSAFAACGGDAPVSTSGEAEDRGDASFVDVDGHDATTTADARSDAAGSGGGDDGEASAPDTAIIVETEQGPVRGALDDGVPSFRKIPYALPPVGPLRWRAPVAPSAWTAPLDATAFGPSCIQLDTEGDLLPGGSEDCLTLNIWTPPGAIAAGASLPVLVFIHGGYFVKGGATYEWHGERVYDGAQLATLANAVVVTVQYRLGAFGFLAHPALSLPQAPHGNYGLLDQIAALQDVRANIGHFGGDAGNVTIFGQSSGGNSVAALIASPLASGLFSRAIIESGGFSAYSVATGTSDADLAATALGCSTASDVAACLRAEDAADVAVALPDSALGPVRWHFLVDGYALPDDPLSLMSAGTFNKVPVILGSNRDELSAMVYDYLRAADLPTPHDQTVYESDVGALYPDDKAAVLAEYPYAAYAASPVSGLAQLLADDQYTCPTRQAARALAANGVPVYRYLFVHTLDVGDATDGGLGNSVYGAYHFLEVPFVFHAMAPTDLVFSADEYALSAQMISLWGSFARTGVPSGAAVPWPLYPSAPSMTVDAGSAADAGDAGSAADGGDGGDAGAHDDPYLSIDVQSVAADGVRSTFCDFWDSH